MGSLLVRGERGVFMTLQLVIDVFLHTREFLEALLSGYSVWVYVVLFCVIFIETGLVVMPFLPGDSILFGIGAIAASTDIVHGPLMMVILCAAAVLGDTANYEIGRVLGDKIRNRKKVRFIKQEYIDKTQEYFEKYGGKTVTIARFMPFIRTFAPFVAGAARMKYTKFLAYNLIGGVMWVCLIFGIGFFFGNLDFVKNHFSLVTLMIIVISLMPMVITLIREKLKKA